jgi:two-component system LytT family sensor kinase
MTYYFNTKRGLIYAVIIALLSCSKRMSFNGNDQILASLQDVFLVTLDIFLCWLINYLFLANNVSLRLRMGKLKGMVPVVVSFSLLVGVNSAYTLFITNPYYLALQSENTFPGFHGHLSTSLLISIFSYLLVHYELIDKRYKNSLIENEQLRREHIGAQLNLLKQQLSPHFLFNSLGTLRAISKDVKTKWFVHQLAMVYRYLLKFSNEHLVQLSDEAEFMNAYIFIIKERFENAIQFHVLIPAELMNRNIPSISLQLLIENAIKHNRASLEEPMVINVVSKFPETITVENTFQPRTSPQPRLGYGLKNLNDRYRLLVNKEITVSSETSTFSVTLPLLK